MKKKFITAILAVSCVGLSVGSAFAALVTCSNVSITGIGTTTNPAIVSGLTVTVKNETGVACGTLLNGLTRRYALNDVNTDQTYATLLTALSLQKKLTITTGETADSLLFVAAIKN
jgi:hypothetical protein